MTPDGFLGSILRRWPIVVLGVLASLAGSIFIYQSTAPELQRVSSFVLLPGSASVAPGDNPFLRLPELEQASDVLVNALQASQVQEPFLNRHPDARIEVERAADTDGPLFTVEVTAGAEATVQDIMDGFLAEVPTVLNDLQDRAQVPDTARIAAELIYMDTESVVSLTPAFQRAGIVAVGGILATLALVALVDNVARRRQPRGGRSRTELLR